MKNQSLLFRVIAALMVYFVLKYYGGSFGRVVLYPVNLLVAFMHEFGHALGAILTGGSVETVHIARDGSGYCETRGGSPGVILMGGYIGSAVFGNLLFHIGAVKERMAQMAINSLSLLMILVSVFWFSSFETIFLLVVLAVGLYVLANKTTWEKDILMFLGLASVLHIIEDFSIGPRSDLEQYSRVIPIFPTSWWMYIWLAIVIALSWWNLRKILRF